ncbi:MAG: hypothetical protein JXA10_02695, partial [Anaerolineae bacterium]|nr:hypothetical protein [Anaerolineae bacterium]
MYILSTVIATTGYLALGTTGERRMAEIGVVLMVLASGWAYMALLPLTILGLYFQPWLQQHQRALFTAALLGVFPAEIAFIWLSRLPDRPWVYQIDAHAWSSWLIALAADSPFWGIVMVLGSQVMIGVALGWTLHKKRLTLRDQALPLLLVSTFSMIIAFIAPLGGREWMILIAGTNFIPPVVMLSVLIMRAARAMPFEALIRSLQNTPGEHLAILDAHRHVLWHNLDTAPWVNVPVLNTFTLPHIIVLLNDSALCGVVRQLLDTGMTAREVEIEDQGEEYVLNISLEPFKHAQVVQANQLIRFQDVTTARVRRNLLDRSRELVALSAISADIAASLDMEQVIQRALQHVPEMTGARGAAVYLRDERSPDDFILTGQWMDAAHPLALPSQFACAPIGPENPVRRAAETRRTVVITTLA